MTDQDQPRQPNPDPSAAPETLGCGRGRSP
jgi:hypothetical protein